MKNKTLPSHPSSPPGPLSPCAGVDRDTLQVKIQRYEDVVNSLKRLLEAERKRTRQARAAHVAELQQRTELQAILRSCVEDVRQRRAQVQGQAQGGRGGEAEGEEEGGSGRTSLSGSGSGSGVQGQGNGWGSGRGSSSQGRPGSAAPTSGSLQRPTSAALVASLGRHRPISAGLPVPGAVAGLRPSSGRPSSGRPGSAVPSSNWSGGRGEAGGLDTAGREQLVSELLSREDLLKLLFEKGFPGVVPHPPGDPYIDKLVQFQEARDVQVRGGVPSGRGRAGEGGQGHAGGLRHVQLTYVHMRKGRGTRVCVLSGGGRETCRAKHVAWAECGGGNHVCPGGVWGGRRRNM